jgi:hypothetical protein
MLDISQVGETTFTKKQWTNVIRKKGEADVMMDLRIITSVFHRHLHGDVKHNICLSHLRRKEEIPKRSAFFLRRTTTVHFSCLPPCAQRHGNKETAKHTGGPQ